MAAPTESTFWVVWNPDGSNPQVRHRFHDHAATEAKRLARACPGQRFFVLEVVDCFEVDDLIHTRYEREIPF